MMIISQRQQNYTTIRAAFRSENGAIDLASIMVGIIVIGLIGGVIAATVFAVIPWAQDNAAKEQLQSIHISENAFYGLSADPLHTTDKTKRNIFTNSTGLESASLLTTNPAYCVIPTADGQNYNAYVKSTSGKIWKATNSSKQAVIKTGTGITCLGTVENGVLIPDSPKTEFGNGDNPAPQPTPTPEPENDYGIPVGTIVYNNDFESTTFNTFPTGWVHSSGSTATYGGVKTPSQYAASNTQTAYNGLYYGWTKGNITKVMEIKNAGGANFKSPFVTLQPGVYTASSLIAKGAHDKAWVNWKYEILDGSNSAIAVTTWIDSGDTAYNWQTRTVEFTVTTAGQYQMRYSGDGGSETGPLNMFDDVLITKTANLP